MAKKTLTINEDTIESFIKNSNRLNRVEKPWYCDATCLGGMHEWFSPQMFEQLVITDPKALELAKKATDGKGLEKFETYLETVLYVKYVKIILGKLRNLTLDLSDYFVAKAQINWEDDKKEYAKYPNGGIEQSTIKHNLIDRD